MNEDQQASFDQLTLQSGFTDEKALELIQELCIEKGHTGLKVERYVLTPKGKQAAWTLWMERIMGETISDAFRQATKDKGIFQYILACICVAVCFPIGICWGLIKICQKG